MQIIEHSCDVLVVGGGLAGCMAAIRAAELSDRVILVDKSNPRRSGCAATGVDHIWAYFPEVQGPEGVSLEDLVNDHIENVAKGLINREIIHYIAATSLSRILDLERFGVKVRFADSTLPGNFRLQYQMQACRNTLHFDGRDVKRHMTRAALERGVEIAERVIVVDLLVHDGQVAGAVGYGTRDGCLHLFRAKAVILSAGRPNRLYKTHVGEVFSTRMPPTLTGDGKAAMYRAGVEIINMECVSIPGRWASKDFVRGGGLPRGSYQPSGIGLNALNEVIWPRNHELPNYGQQWRGRLTQPGTGKSYGSEMQAGRGPIYADMSWGSDEDQEYVRWSVGNEGSGWGLNHILEQYGLDYRTTKIEITGTEPEHSGAAACGPIVDKHCQTSLPGLYAAGDEAGGVPGSVVPGALTMGYLSAEQAAEFAAKMAHVPEGKGEGPTLEFCTEIMARQDGDPWQDAQAFVQNNMSHYNIALKSETMAQRGLECLAYLKETMRLVAGNPHEMTHCLEVRNIIENGEMVLRATIERQESRPGIFKRVDYPERDDENFFCWLGQRKIGDEAVFQKHYP
jgi:succinate dehydrogenase/fumarate reductase flavoprotein subunit